MNGNSVFSPPIINIVGSDTPHCSSLKSFNEVEDFIVDGLFCLEGPYVVVDQTGELNV